MNEGGGNQGADDGLLEGQMRDVKATSALAVEKYKSGIDDFEEWVDLFEKAVKLATNVRDDNILPYLYREWLPLKLDSTALAARRQVTAAGWIQIKEELAALLVDPQERYKWQVKLQTIKWDGKESFHALAARVTRAVNKFDKDMPDAFKTREYFFRFRSAFKKPWRKVIDLGCRANERTIENAKDVALRYQLTLADEDGDDRADEPTKSVTFAGATLHADRATGIETSLAGIAMQLENLSLTMRSQDERLARVEDRQKQVDGGQRREDYHRGENAGYRDFRGRSPSWGNLPSRERYDRRVGGPDASRDPSSYRGGDGVRPRQFQQNRTDDRGNCGPYGANRQLDYGSGDSGAWREDRRNNLGDERRNDRREDRRDERQDEWRGGQDDRRGDAYRAIDTEDECSSDGSIAGEENGAAREERATGQRDRGAQRAGQRDRREN